MREHRIPFLEGRTVMSHVHPQPRTSFPPATSAQQEAAHFDRLIEVCDRQDDLIRRQQLEIERLRQQLAGQPAKVETHHPSPPQAQVRSAPKAPRPEPMTPTPLDSPSTKQKTLASPRPATIPTSDQLAKETAPLPKACLPKGLPPARGLPEGATPRREPPTPKTKATRPGAAISFDPQDHRAPALPEQSLQRELKGTSRQPLPPLQPEGEMPDPATKKVGPPRSGNHRVRELLDQYFDRVPTASGQQPRQDTGQASRPRWQRDWPEHVDRWPSRLNN